MNKCPCTECICRPICYGKSLGYLMRECQLISNYYYSTVTDNLEFLYKTIVEILKPQGI